ncbi:MAG: queuosine salvage family protein [Solirubrobacteraceae bacterium]
MDDLRAACATVAEQALHVHVVADAIETAYAIDRPVATPDLPTTRDVDREPLAARWLTLDAVNFGSGWFPTVRKRPGLSGARTIAAALDERFEARGPWSAEELIRLNAGTLAPILGQDPGHELIALYAASLNDLGEQLRAHHGGSFAAALDAAGGSAVTLARMLGGWPCFADRSKLHGIELPFLKRAQIAAADLHRAGAARFADLHRLTMFADNLVPHVLRLDGVLRFAPALVARIERGELIAHGSREEIEIRACAVHAVELLVRAGAGTSAVVLDQALWQRGQLPRYKATPRHRSRCTGY